MSAESGALAIKLAAQKDQGENCDWLSFDIHLAVTADFYVGPSDNPAATGMIIQIDLQTMVGSPTYKLHLCGYDANNVKYDVWEAITAVSANGTYLYWLGPGPSSAPLSTRPSCG